MYNGYRIAFPLNIDCIISCCFPVKTLFDFLSHSSNIDKDISSFKIVTFKKFSLLSGNNSRSCSKILQFVVTVENIILALFGNSLNIQETSDSDELS